MSPGVSKSALSHKALIMPASPPSLVQGANEEGPGTFKGMKISCLEDSFRYVDKLFDAVKSYYGSYFQTRT